MGSRLGGDNEEGRRRIGHMDIGVVGKAGEEKGVGS